MSALYINFVAPDVPVGEELLTCPPTTTPHFTDKETKAQTGQGTCPVSHSQKEAELGEYSE